LPARVRRRNTRGGAPGAGDGGMQGDGHRRRESYGGGIEGERGELLWEGERGSPGAGGCCLLGC
jgi:hypothetical protein